MSVGTEIRLLFAGGVVLLGAVAVALQLLAARLVAGWRGDRDLAAKRAAGPRERRSVLAGAGDGRVLATQARRRLLR